MHPMFYGHVCSTSRLDSFCGQKSKPWEETNLKKNIALPKSVQDCKSCVHRLLVFPTMDDGHDTNTLDIPHSQLNLHKLIPSRGNLMLGRRYPRTHRSMIRTIASSQTYYQGKAKLQVLRNHPDRHNQSVTGSLFWWMRRRRSHSVLASIHISIHSCMLFYTRL
jgi:hypothetical protein